MTLRPILFLLLSGILASLASGAAEPIEVYFFSNQKAYRVEGFEEEQPILSEEVDGATLGYTGERHDAWWVKGELPLAKEFAIPVADAGLTLRPKPYRERHAGDVYEVDISYYDLFKEEAGLLERKDGLLVSAWMVEGEARGFAVFPTLGYKAIGSRYRMAIDSKDREGYLLCWVLEAGQVVPRKAVHPWDALFFGETVDFDKLAKKEDKLGRTPLHYAAANGLESAVRSLIEVRKKLVSQKDSRDETALSFAAKSGRAAVAQILLEAKAPVEDGWEDTNVIARAAAARGHREVVALLTPGKVKGDTKKRQYSWALASALNKNYHGIASDLIEKGSEFTLPRESRGQYVLAKFSDGYPDIGFLVMRYFQVEPRYSHEGYNLAHAVAAYADVELLQKVKSLGVDIAEATKSGLRPMDVAAGLGNVEAICWFIENGGRVDDSKQAVDPLKHAIVSGRGESVSCLISYGYDVNREVGSHLTPLMYAVYLREFEIAEAIAGAGGVWDLESEYMDVLALRVVESDRSDLLLVLEKQGWDLKRRLLGEIRIQDAADFYGSATILEMLVERGFELEGAGILSLKSVDTKPRLTRPLIVDYPEELQSKFGEQNLRVRIALGANGQPLLFDVGKGLDPELYEVVEKAVYGLEFSPAMADGKEAMVAMTLGVPLEVDFDPKSVFEVFNLTEKPRPVQMAAPLYPYALQQSRSKGRVLLEFVLLADGTVRDLKASEFTHEAFVEPAKSCVLRSVWEPGKIEGKPVSCRIRIPVTFQP